MPDTGIAARAGQGIAPLVRPIEHSAEQVFACWSDTPHIAWLDSGGPLNERSRYSYIAIDPFEVIDAAHPFDRLADALQRFRQPTGQAPTPFAGGAVGFLGYELGAALDRTPRHPAPPGVPDCSIGLYDVVFAFDRLQARAWLISSGLPETDPGRRAARAAARAHETLARLARHRTLAPAPVLTTPVHLAWQPAAPRAQHEARVARTIAYIEAGDIYQANIAATFHAARPAGLRAADIHLALRAGNPAPFTAYVAAGPDCTVASVSPERFLSLSATGHVEARPIKGTRRRHPDPVLDAALQADLLSSTKDHAENLMIVDLLRNDIARVCDIGSVHVPALARLESFAGVHHLVSVVAGRLRPDATATDLLRATFPGGSITGAPKLRAQEIIHALERQARGPYCGAILWMGWDGAMDSSIAIRTATITPDVVTVQAGGGIVADSDPRSEYEEVLVKVTPLVKASGSF